MGGQEVKETSPQDIIQYLNDLLPVAMSVGMSIDDYWRGEPSLLKVYLKAEEHRQRRSNHELWLQGAYIYHALCCASPMFNSLAKDHKPRPYLKEPFAMSVEEDEERKYQKFKRQMLDLTKINK